MAKQNHSLIQHPLLSRLTHNMKREIAPNFRSATQQPFITSRKHSWAFHPTRVSRIRRDTDECVSQVKLQRRVLILSSAQRALLVLRSLGSSIFGCELPDLFRLLITLHPKETLGFKICGINVVCLL